MSYTDLQLEILTSITKEIGNQARTCAAEQYAPSHEADQMDDIIKTRKENVASLRQIRERLENIFTGII